MLQIPDIYHYNVAGAYMGISTFHISMCNARRPKITSTNKVTFAHPEIVRVLLLLITRCGLVHLLIDDGENIWIWQVRVCLINIQHS